MNAYFEATRRNASMAQATVSVMAGGRQRGWCIDGDRDGKFEQLENKGETSAGRQCLGNVPSVPPQRILYSSPCWSDPHVLDEETGRGL